MYVYVLTDNFELRITHEQKSYQAEFLQILFLIIILKKKM